jgi:hypothetical protein
MGESAGKRWVRAAMGESRLEVGETPNRRAPPVGERVKERRGGVGRWLQLGRGRRNGPRGRK